MALRFAGYHPDQYNTHPFRIGAATTAVMLVKLMIEYSKWVGGNLTPFKNTLG